MALPWPAWNRTGGAERHVHELACALVRAGVQVTALTPAPASPPPQGLPYGTLVLDGRALRASGALRARLPVGATLAKRAYDRAFNRLAAHAARRLAADVLHRHFVYEVGFRPALPLVYTLHNGDLPSDELRKAGVRGVFASLDRRRRLHGLRRGIADAHQVICVSEHVRSSVLGRLGLARDAAVIHNGCPHPAPTVGKAEARRRLGLAQERIVLFIGHLWRHKRVDRLLPLLEEKDCVVALIGKGEMEARLAQVAATQPRLRLLGYVDEETKRLWLRAADVLAVPSGDFEGNPIVMMEALRAGTPVYGATPTWLPESLRPFGRFGDDIRLAMDAMGIDATPAIALVPGWDEVAQRTLQVYRDAIKARGS